MRQYKEYSESITNKVKDAIETAFPVIEAKNKNLTVSNVTFDPIPDGDDYNRQKSILFNQKTEGVGMYADVQLKDKSGKVLDEKKKMKIGLLPTVSNRNSFIINGKEYIVFNQMRLKPGIYTKYDLNDQPTADLNLAKGRNMSITYHPEKQRLLTSIKSTNVPLYTILKDVYKVPDSKLAVEFGSELHRSESDKHMKDSDKYLKSLHKIIVNDGSINKLKEEMSKEIKDKLDKTIMDPVINTINVGKAYDKVSDDALISAAKKVINIHKGLENPTLKDNLAYKSIHSTEDFLHERLIKNAPMLKNEMKFKIDNANKISETGINRKLNDQIHSFFSGSNLVNYALQINPMEFLENSHKLTSMGEGAISDVNALPLAQRDIDVSHLGFIDIVRTPDNMRAGVDVRAALQATKKNNELVTHGFDKKGKLTELTPLFLINKTYAMLGEKPVADGLFRAFHKGKMVEVPKDKIDYFIDPNYAFTVTTGSIPDLNTNQGQRNAMGAKMQTQALSLEHREAPLVTTVARKLFEGIYVPKAKVSGTVTNVNSGIIEITDDKGEKHTHNIPYNFPLNYHSYLHVDPKVSVGDKVKKDQILGDHNFSRDGKLALGVNMNVAYMPYYGLNNDDAFVITQQGADKLTSLHSHSFELELGDGVVSDLNKYKAYFPYKYSMNQLMKLNGTVVKKGEKLENGDPIVLALRKKVESPEVSHEGKMISRMSNPWNDVSLKWDKDYPGEVIDVVVNPGHIRVIVKAKSPMEVGSKISGLYGNKGVVGAIVPNHLAPKKADGSIPDVIMNPAAIPSRMNTAQVFETALGKAIKEKKLDTMYIKAFDGQDSWKRTKDFIQKHGISETDKYFDPVSGKDIKFYDKDKKQWNSSIYNGSQYIMKLFKEAESGYSARAGGAYDIDMRPIRGGEEGSKAVGNLDMAGLLAHGNTRHILNEISTYKAEYNPEFWSALLQGKPLPAPKATFAFNKFTEMMRGMGINLKKEGHTMKLLPFTDNDILKMSSGEIKSPATAMMKEDPETGLPFRPERGGLFDPAKTGGLKGTRWTHVKLATPVVNALYEKAIRSIVDLKQDDFRKIAEGSKSVTVDGKNLTGGFAIQQMLKKIDPEVEVPKLFNQLKETKSKTKKDDILKKIKYLEPLKQNNLKPHEAYVLNYMPVIPPQFRPIYPKQSGELVVSDANHLYANMIKHNQMMGSEVIQMMGQESEEYKKQHKALYDSVRKVQGLDGVIEETDFSNREPKGFLKTIIGGNAKYGYFQGKLVSKVQDIVGRAAVTPSNELGIDELGIPEKMAWKLYKPDIIGEMSKMGYSIDKSEDHVTKKTTLAKNILLTKMNEQPVILNRAPTLHKFNMMAFKPKLVTGKHIKMCPLVNKGFNADYDGDQLNVHVMKSPQAIKETWNLLPSNNLFNPLNSNPMFQPDQEAVKGLHAITSSNQQKPIARFKTVAELKKAEKEGKIGVSDLVEVEELK